MKVDIGGGRSPQPGHVNLDPIHGQGDWKRPVQDGIPAADGTVDAVFASHVMEHIPAGQERIDVCNEIWRVLKPGGTFEIRVPLLVTPDGKTHWEAVADPTHVSFWTMQSFQYLSGDLSADADYGLERWRLERTSVRDGWEGQAVLTKP